MTAPLGFFRDFVRELVSATGTADYTTGGIPVGTHYVPLNLAYGSGVEILYTVRGTTSAQWEIVRGTYTHGTLTLSRTTVVLSWNGSALGTSKISWASGDGQLVAFVAPVAQQANGWITLDSAAISGAASYILDGIPSWANHLRVTLDVLPVNNNPLFEVIARKSSGTDIAGSSYQVQRDYGSGSTASANTSLAAASLPLAGGVQNSATAGGGSHIVFFTHIQSARYKRGVAFNIFNDASVYYISKAGFRIDDTAAITGLKARFDSGNISEGRVLVEVCP